MKTCLICLAVWIIAFARGSVFGDNSDAKKPPLAAYVPTEAIAPTNHVIRVLRVDKPFTNPNMHSLTLRRSSGLTEAERWERFEDEFHIRKRSDSAVKNGVQDAKYSLDFAVFTLDRFVRNFEDSLEFEYRFNHGSLDSPQSAQHVKEPPRPYFSPWRDAMENARLRSDVDLDVGSGKAWLGMRLIVPFGD